MKKHAHQNNNQQKYPPVLTPPDGFGIVEAGIYRSFSGLQEKFIPFLERLHIRTAVYISSDPLPKGTSNYLTSQQIQLVNPLDSLGPERRESWSPTDLGEEVMKEALEVLLDTTNHPILLLESSENAESVLVGCLRRLQIWSLTAIFDEYRAFPKQSSRLYDENEQLIERFDPDLVTLPENLPPWFVHHLQMLNKEEQQMVEDMDHIIIQSNDPRSSTGAGECTNTDNSRINMGKGDNIDTNRKLHEEKQNVIAYVDRLPLSSYWGPLTSSSCVFSEKLSILDEDDDG
mmetsp:Transcript_31158/g.39098  ORF Transcript_31158/g.39098 Transcript_31158/m.39098 type:complete len:288 (-) Transcript_31158:19-882(-)